MPEWRGFASRVITLSGAALSGTDDEAVPTKEYGERLFGTEVNRRISCWIECQTGQVRYPLKNTDSYLLRNLGIRRSLGRAEIRHKLPCRTVHGRKIRRQRAP